MAHYHQSLPGRLLLGFLLVLKQGYLPSRLENQENTNNWNKIAHSFILRIIMVVYIWLLLLLFFFKGYTYKKIL